MKKKYDLTFLENIWYYLSVVCSLGLWFTVKVVIKKALSEE